MTVKAKLPPSRASLAVYSKDYFSFAMNDIAHNKDVDTTYARDLGHLVRFTRCRRLLEVIKGQSTNYERPAFMWRRFAH